MTTSKNLPGGQYLGFSQPQSCSYVVLAALRNTSHKPFGTYKKTVYLSNIQYDSIYISQDKLIDRSKDTLYIRDVSVEYRYKLLRDTVRIVQRDSIPYEVTIVQTKEIKRPLTWYDHLSRAILWLNIGFVLLLFVRFIRKLKAFGS